MNPDHPVFPSLPVLAALLALVLATLPAAAADPQAAPAAEPTTAQIDPAIQALAMAEVWQRELDQALRAHIDQLAIRGDARSLAAAALLLLPDHADGDADADEAWEAVIVQRSAWLTAALAADSGDPVLLWLGARGLPGSPAEPQQRATALDELARFDPDNAAIWLDLMAQALADDQPARVDEYLQRAAQASRFDAYELAVGQLLQDALADFQAPPMPEDVRQVVAEQAAPGEAGAWLDHPEHARIFFIASVLGMNAPLPFNTGCKPSLDNALIVSRRSACLAIAGRVAGDARFVAARQVALAMRLRLAGDLAGPAQVQRWREDYRDGLWQVEQVQAVMQGREGKRLPGDHSRHAIAEGEHAAWLHALAANGIPATAPDGWLPEQASARQLLGADDGG
ncbi:MAG: hypothetical protein M0Q42_08640 [Xanthomonadales bacterium]|nr:hypothetical protein [Xanthomonadales bacterium]